MAQGFMLRTYMGVMQKPTGDEPHDLEGRMLPDGEEKEIIFCKMYFPILPVTMVEADAIHELFKEFLKKVFEVTADKGELH